MTDGFDFIDIYNLQDCEFSIGNNPENSKDGYWISSNDLKRLETNYKQLQTKVKELEEENKQLKLDLDTWTKISSDDISNKLNIVLKEDNKKILEENAKLKEELARFK